MAFPLPVAWRLTSCRIDVLACDLQEMLIDGRAPTAGEVFKNPTLAATFRALGEGGKAGFYSGRIAKAICKVVQDLGGVLSEEVPPPCPAVPRLCVRCHSRLCVCGGGV